MHEMVVSFHPFMHVHLQLEVWNASGWLDQFNTLHVVCST